MHLNQIFKFIIEIFKTIMILSSAGCSTEKEKDFEIVALRSQLALFQEKVINNKIPKPRVDPAFRLFWIFLSKRYNSWKKSFVILKPETVIGWHRKAFKFYWKHKSRKSGRPAISMKTILLIKRIHKENPLLSPEKIHERLVNMAISDIPTPKTIAKYIKDKKNPPTDKQKQAWKTFLKNYTDEIWSMDFFIVPTLRFKVLYVFVIVSHARRKIEHFAITANPNLLWVKQQIREAVPYDTAPSYLIHDNDAVFTSEDFREFLAGCNIKSVRTAYHSPWQNGICERTVGILRQELLNHIVPINEKHLQRLLSEYVEYYNHDRTHQGIKCQTPVPSDRLPETTVNNTKLISKPILNGLYHSYKKVA